MLQKEIKTEAEAIQYAIEWSTWAGEQNLSYQELADWYIYFTSIAKKFDLVKEFVENGII